MNDSSPQNFFAHHRLLRQYSKYEPSYHIYPCMSVLCAQTSESVSINLMFRKRQPCKIYEKARICLTFSLMSFKGGVYFFSSNWLNLSCSITKIIFFLVLFVLSFIMKLVGNCGLPDRYRGTVLVPGKFLANWLLLWCQQLANVEGDAA